MNITLINTSDYKLIISDLGIEIDPTEVIDLYSSFSAQELLISSGISALYSSAQNFRILINGVVIGTYVEFVQKLTFLTQSEHETIPTLKHQEYEQYYFEVTKLNSRSKFITYYKDNTKVEKIREETINRNIDGRVSSVRTVQYDAGQNIVSDVTEILNRDASGKVISTSMEQL